MLKENENKLRLTDSDAVEHLCQQIGDWPSDVMSKAEQNEQVHNFTMKSRFLLEGEDMMIDKTSQCPVPKRLSASTVGGKGAEEEPTLIAQYKSEDQDNPRRVLEDLFRELDPLTSEDFD